MDRENNSIKNRKKIKESKPDKQVTPSEGMRKINLRKALHMRLYNKLTYQEIANKFESTRQSVWKALKPFEQYIKDPEAVEAFRHSKADILDAVMMEVLRLLVDEDKQKSATLGNVGYVLRILNELVRLERGQATSNIQSLLVKATKKLEELDPS